MEPYDSNALVRHKREYKDIDTTLRVDTSSLQVELMDCIQSGGADEEERRYLARERKEKKLRLFGLCSHARAPS